MTSTQPINSHNEPPEKLPNKRSPMSNAILLTLLYTLQGVPLGLSFGSIPYLIQQQILVASGNSTSPQYAKTLGIFSLCSYPYSVKILWAPLIDSFYSKSVGRRKSWILPVQLIASLFMFFIGVRIQEWIELLHIGKLSAAFFCMVLFCSMQDVAVDGWGLKLARDSAALCQSVGISTGYFLSYTIFLVLSSPELRNWALGVQDDVPFISLKMYLWFWASMYFLLTVFVALFVTEQPEKSDIQLVDGVKSKDSSKYGELGAASMQMTSSTGDASSLDTAAEKDGSDSSSTQSKKPVHESPSAFQVVKNVYAYTFNVLFRIKNIHWFIFLWITARLATSVADTLTPIKLIEKGMKKDSIALIASILAPLEYLWVWLGSRLEKRYGALTLWSRILLMRISVGLLGTLIVYSLPEDMAGQALSWKWFVFCLISMMLYSSTSSIMFVCQSSFFNQISDESMGGTYSTLLNTFSNLAGTLPKFFIFKLADVLTQSECEGSNCSVVSDGYYALSVLAVCYGFAWFFLMNRRIKALEDAPISSWRLPPPAAAKSKTH